MLMLCYKQKDGLQLHITVNTLYWEDILANLKYRLACIYCESYHTAEQGIQLHQDLVKYYERLVLDL